MLVLTRKLGEKVVIGDNIFLTVVAIRGNEVRLGLTAPTEIPIRRMEICCPLDPPSEPDPQGTGLPAQRAGLRGPATPSG